MDMISPSKVIEKDNFHPPPLHPQAAKNEDKCSTDLNLDQESLANLLDHYKNGLNISEKMPDIAASLGTDLVHGIQGDDGELGLRHEVFGSNIDIDEAFPITRKDYFKKLICHAVTDTTVILLLCCAALSLLLEIKKNGVQQAFLEGLYLFSVISTILVISFLMKIFNNRSYNKLSRNKAAVAVIRRGISHKIAVSEVVVGDILCLKSGDTAPADGLIIPEHCKELKLDDDPQHEELDHTRFQWIFTDARVLNGECRILVTSVGKNTEKGKMMKMVNSAQSKNNSKLQISIDKTSSGIEKVFLSLSLLVLAVQVLACFAWQATDRNGDNRNRDSNNNGVRKRMEDIMAQTTQIIQKNEGRSRGSVVMMLGILLLAIKDGLPLGILVFLWVASKRIEQYYSSTVRELAASATTGFVTTICMSRSSDLALDYTKMADLWVGPERVREAKSDLAPELIDHLREGIIRHAIRPSDDALLFWAQHFFYSCNEEIKFRGSTVVVEASDFKKNQERLVLFRTSEEDEKTVADIYWRGAPDIALSVCSCYYNRDGTIEALDERKIANLMKIVEGFMRQAESLSCIAFAYKETRLEVKEEVHKLVGKDLTLLGFVVLKNPYTPDVQRAIETWKMSEAEIKLVTDENINMARLIAMNSGILKPEEVYTNAAVIDACVFRNLPKEDQTNMVNSIRVLANASPSDKLQMIKALKQNGQVVAVTGVCTRDSPCLKEADVGVALGHESAEATMDSSDVVISDGRFATMAAIFDLGRVSCRKLQMFIQLHFTLNISAFTINLLASVLSSQVLPLSSFQIFWVNLITDILGALALAAGEAPVAAKPLEIMPVCSADRLISKTMWKNIAVQVVYQVIIFLVLYFKGMDILHVDEKAIQAIFFNCYVICQVFVLLNAAMIERISVLEGIKMLKINGMFFLIAGIIIIVLQVGFDEIFVFVPGGYHRLNINEWCFSFGVAAMSLPVSWVASIAWP